MKKCIALIVSESKDRRTQAEKHCHVRSFWSGEAARSWNFGEGRKWRVSSRTTAQVNGVLESIGNYEVPKVAA